MSNLQTALQYPPLEQWLEFIEKFKQFEGAEEEPVQVVMLDANCVEAFFQSFREQYTPFFEKGGTINVWEIAKCKYDEVRNCAVLGWLLDCNGSHGQKHFFLECFLNCWDKKPINPDCLSSGYKVTVEQSYENISQEIGDEPDNEPSRNDSSGTDNLTGMNTKNRVDFVIENTKFILFIEAKIKAKEGNTQLKRYSHLLKKSARQRRHALIFLTTTDYTPLGIDGLPIQPLCITWQKIAVSFEEAMKKRLGKDVYGTFNQPLWASLAQQFCCHIKNF